MPNPTTQGRLLNFSNARFTTTNWSVVLRARDADTQSAEEALEKLCRTYWQPLYAFIRRDGYSAADAQDMTQEFLSRLVHKGWLEHLQHQRGRFRSFLLKFLKHFLSDQRDHANAQKRGGGNEIVSFDAYEDEERLFIQGSGGYTPEQLFDRRLAQRIMEVALETLRSEYVARNKAAIFEHVKDLQPGSHGQRTYAEIGIELGLSEQAMKSEVFRFRRRYSEILREEIARTVADPQAVDEEIRHLMRAVVG